MIKDKIFDVLNEYEKLIIPFITLVILTMLMTSPEGKNPLHMLLKNKKEICQSIIFLSTIFHLASMTEVILLNLIPDSKSSRLVKMSEHYKEIKNIFTNTAKRYIYCILITTTWLFHTTKNYTELIFLTLTILTLIYAISGTFQTIWITEKIIELKTEKE